MAAMRIHTEKLQEGMVIARTVVNISGTPLVVKGTTLTESIIRKIENTHITSVYIESLPDSKDTPKIITNTENIKDCEEFKKFEQNFKEAKYEIKKVVNDIIEKDEDIDVDKLLEQVNKLTENSSTSVEILEMINLIKDDSDIIFKHSLNVALLCSMISKWLKMGAFDSEMLIVSAMLHDIGVLKLPPEILDNLTNLTQKQKNMYKKHAVYGYNILKDRNIDSRIAMAALGHHERQDGSGYPLMKRGLLIDEFSRIIAIADVFDGMTESIYTGNKYNCIFDVIRMFETDGYMKFDPEALIIFLSRISDTYINKTAQLSDGRIGKIVFANKSKPSCPMIKIKNRYIDLSKEFNLKVVKLLD